MTDKEEDGNVLDLKQEAANLLAGLRYGTIRSTAYDTAWVASIPDHRNPSKSLFPEALAWLARNQHEDGSWGGELEYYTDRVVCTLAALIALARMGRRQADRERIARGERYLWKNIHKVTQDPYELVCSELIVPVLMDKARQLGVSLPKIRLYEREREQKLRLIPGGMTYSRNNTVVHSLEYLGD